MVQYWHDGAPPEDVAERIATFPACNPDRPHLLFDAPAAEALIAEDFDARHLAASRACGPPAMQADYFRLCAIYALGGVYADADCFCRKELSPFVAYAGRLCRAGWHLTNHLFGFAAPEHPLLGLAIEFATRGIEARATQHVTVVVGPGVFTTLINVAEMGSVDAFAGALREFIESKGARDPRATAGLRCWLEHTESMRPLLEDHECLVTAGSDVHVSPRAEVESLVSHEPGRLGYTDLDQHYPNWRGSIYDDRRL